MIKSQVCYRIFSQFNFLKDSIVFVGLSSNSKNNFLKNFIVLNFQILFFIKRSEYFRKIYSTVFFHNHCFYIKQKHTLIIGILLYTLSFYERHIFLLFIIKSKIRRKNAHNNKSENQRRPRGS